MADVQRGPELGIAIQAPTAAAFVEDVRRAEELGVPTAWATIQGAGGADPLTAFAAAAMATQTIRLGTAIIPTWPRHVLALASQALAVHELAPDRLRLGIGPSHEPMMTRGYGVTWEAPLTNLREYLEALRALLTTGEVAFEGQHVTARHAWKGAAEIELLASALRPRSFELCGALTDGAISWMCPRSYLEREALPAVERGAREAGREAPPVIAHVPVAVAERATAHALAQEQLGRYRGIPFYRAMFERTGFGPVDDAYPEALLDDLVVCGSEDEVVAGLRRYLDGGCGEVLAMPLLQPDDRAGSFERAARAVARAHREVRA